MPFQPGYEGYNKGKKLSDETSKKMSIGQKKTYENGRIPWFLGKRLTKEHRLNISQGKKEWYKHNPSPNLDLKRTQEHKDAISKANKGRTLSPEHIAKRTATLKANIKKRTGERRSEGLLRYYSEHEVWNKGLSWSFEVREKIRQGCLNSSIGMSP